MEAVTAVVVTAIMVLLMIGALVAIGWLTIELLDTVEGFGVRVLLVAGILLFGAMGVLVALSIPTVWTVS